MCDSDGMLLNPSVYELLQVQNDGVLTIRPVITRLVLHGAVETHPDLADIPPTQAAWTVNALGRAACRFDELETFVLTEADMPSRKSLPIGCRAIGLYADRLSELLSEQAELLEFIPRFSGQPLRILKVVAGMLYAPQ